MPKEGNFTVFLHQKPSLEWPAFVSGVVIELVCIFISLIVLMKHIRSVITQTGMARSLVDELEPALQVGRSAERGGHANLDRRISDLASP